IPIFFIYVGLNFETSLLMDFTVVKYALLLCLLIITVRVLAGFVFLFGAYRLNNIPVFPFSTSFSLTLLIAAAKLGENLGVFSKDISGGVVLASIISALVFPLFFRLIIKKLVV
ncbi:MAG: hypothetical protein FXF49_01860, partial [Flexistipes sinusarabici]